MSARRYVVAGAGVLLAILAGLLAWDRDAVEQPVVLQPTTAEPQAIGNDVAAAQIVREASGQNPLIEISRKPIRGLPTEECEEEVAQRRARSTERDSEAIRETAIAILGQSNDVDHLLTAGFLSPDSNSRIQYLDRVLALDPSNRVAIWDKLLACAEAGAVCDRGDAEAAAVAVDGSNGLVWLELASARVRAGEWQLAEDALERAALAPRFETYFMDTAVVIEHGLAASSELGYQERLVFGIGVAAAVAVPAFGDITKPCAATENGPSFSVETCRQLGEQMSAQSKELLPVMIGYALRRNSASRLGDDGMAQRLDQEKNDLQESMLHAQADSGALALLENDPAVMRRYVETFLVHGEVDAIKLTVEEARRLREDSTYNQCNFVGDLDVDF